MKELESYRTCFDTSPIPFAILEKKVIDTFDVFIVKYCNVAYSRIFNRNPSELIQKQLTAAFSLEYSQIIDFCTKNGGKKTEVIKNNYNNKSYNAVVYKIDNNIIGTSLNENSLAS